MRNRIVSFILVVMLVVSLVPAVSFAAETKDDNGIITAPAEGTLVTYKRQRDEKAGTSFYLSGQTLYLGYQTETATMVECENGDVYWLNPIGWFTTGNWIVGKKVGSTITFKTKQPVLYNAAYDATLSVRWGYYDGNYNWVSADAYADNFVFNIEDDTLKLCSSAAIYDFSTPCYFPGIFWDDDDSFNGYGDCGVKLSELTLYDVANGTPQAEANSNDGYITVSKQKASEDETVAVYVYPNSNYELESLSYIGVGDEQATTITRSLIGTYLFSMPAKNVTVSAIFQAGPAEFVTADKDHPVSNADTFGYYVTNETTWKGYKFAGWFYNDNGEEKEYTGTFCEAVLGTTYTARWKNAAGNYVLTEGITVGANGVYIGEDGIYATADVTDNGGPKRYVDGLSSGVAINAKLDAQSPAALRFFGSDILPFDRFDADIDYSSSLSGGIKLEDYGISFTKAQNGEPATLTLSGASIEAGDGVDTFYAYGNMYAIEAGIFSTVPLKLVLSGENTVCITRDDEYSCACGIFGGDNVSLTVTGDTLKVDASTAAGFQTGGIILNGGALTNSANLEAVGGRGINSSYGISCGYLTNTAGELIGRAGSGAAFCNGINLNVVSVISGGKVIGYGGYGSIEYYGLWTCEHLTVSKNGTLEVYGGTDDGKTTEAAFYLENDLGVITLTDYGKIVAHGTVRNDGSYGGSYNVSGANTTVTEGSQTELTKTGTDPIVITAPAPVYYAPDPTVSISANHGDDSVKLKATVSGGNATLKDITDKDLEKLLDGENSDTVVLDFSGLSKSVKSVTIPKKSLEKIEAATQKEGGKVEGLTINIPNGTILLSGDTLTELLKQAEGNTIKFAIEGIKESKLTKDQKAAIKKFDKATLFDIYIESNGKRLCTKDLGGFGEEAALMLLPYEMQKGQNEYNCKVFYLAEDGTLENVPALYSEYDKDFILELEHLSVYAVLYSENAPETCAKDSDCPLHAYSDTNMNAWYHDGVHYCIASGIMKGVGGDLFKPTATITRAEVVTMLWRLAGEPYANYYMQFNDVAEEEWYTEAVRWAAAEKIAQGYDNGSFGSNDKITREQFALILTRYSEYAGNDIEKATENVNTLSYNDIFDVSEWAREGMHYCIAVDVIQGNENECVMPHNKTSRAEAATMIYRFCEKVLNK